MKEHLRNPHLKNESKNRSDTRRLLVHAQQCVRMVTLLHLTSVFMSIVLEAMDRKMWSSQHQKEFFTGKAIIFLYKINPITRMSFLGCFKTSDQVEVYDNH